MYWALHSGAWIQWIHWSGAARPKWSVRSVVNWHGILTELLQWMVCYCSWRTEWSGG